MLIVGEGGFACVNGTGTGSQCSSSCLVLLPVNVGIRAAVALELQHDSGRGSGTLDSATSAVHAQATHWACAAGGRVQPPEVHTTLREGRCNFDRLAPSSP